MQESILRLMLWVDLKDDQSFNIIKETLTRIGVVAGEDKTLYQSAHILHKRGDYAIVHFKEMFALDGKRVFLSPDDIARRNTIALMLEQWGMLKIQSPECVEYVLPPDQLTIVPHREKTQWNLVPKYTVGGFRKNRNGNDYA